MSWITGFSSPLAKRPSTCSRNCGVISAFPVFEEWSGALREFIFASFAPTTGDLVQSYLDRFVEQHPQAVQLLARDVAVLVELAGAAADVNQRIPMRPDAGQRLPGASRDASLEPHLTAAPCEGEQRTEQREQPEYGRELAAFPLPPAAGEPGHGRDDHASSASK